ncbi:MAG: hypothetical protein WDZ30_07650 [Cellvibrionaceae bacterium]
MKKLGIAIFFSALVVFMLTFFLGVAEDYANWQVSAVVAGVAAVVSIIALVCIALPLHYVLARAGKLGLGWYVVPGALIGPGFVLGFKPFGQDPTAGLLMQSLVCGSLGAIGAAIFWFVAVHWPRLTKQSKQTV